MASRRELTSLPSDPELLLEYIDKMPEETDSDEEFDGYLDPEDGPVVLHSGSFYEEEESSVSTLPHSRSLETLCDSLHTEYESPFPRASPSLSPMQTASHSPTQQESPEMETTASSSSPTLLSQV